MRTSRSAITRRGSVALLVAAALLASGCARVTSLARTTAVPFSDPSGTVAVATPSSPGASGTSSALSNSSPLVCGAPTTATIFEANAAGSDWNKTNNLIAFDQQSDGYYHIYTVTPSGTDKREIGVNSPTFPDRTVGSPAWYPNGKYIAFIGEKTGAIPGNLKGATFAATPGWGGYSDLWVSTANGSHAWQLTDVPVGNDDGVLLPQFSPDGRLLEWTQKSEGGNGKVDWAIHVARFNLTAAGAPYLTDIQTIAPAAATYPNEFLETGGFSADSSEMLFTSDFQNHLFVENQIYVMNLHTGVITHLTPWGPYDEHPRFTPNGQIIWMTDADQPNRSGGTDWWIMNANGSDAHRLTDFNTPGSAEYMGQKVEATVVDTSNWAANGSYFYGDVELSIITSRTDIMKVSLTCH